MSKTARLATLQTWQPDGRIKRILRQRQIPFTGDPAALITRAAQLNPQSRPLMLMMYFGRRTTKKAPSPALSINFGPDRSGAQTSVSIALEESDVPLMVVYLARFGGQMTGITHCDYIVDDDGGEELRVPRISAGTLALLPTSPVVQ